MDLGDWIWIVVAAVWFLARGVFGGLRRSRSGKSAAKPRPQETVATETTTGAYDTESGSPGPIEPR